MYAAAAAATLFYYVDQDDLMIILVYSICLQGLLTGSAPINQSCYCFDELINNGMLGLMIDAHVFLQREDEILLARNENAQISCSFFSVKKRLNDD
jgi:hypothetical protein